MTINKDFYLVTPNDQLIENGGAEMYVRIEREATTEIRNIINKY